MIVARWIWHVKPESVSEALSILQETVEWFTPRRVRFYRPGLGPTRNTISGEVEFESLSDYEEFWAKQSAKPEHASVVERLGKLIASYHIETWTLVQ
jgi:hypothetical protein